MKKYTNSEVAEILKEMGDILEMRGENPFRIRAFQNASRSVEFLAEDINEIYQKQGLDGLNEIQGVGEGIAKRIERLLKTGKLDEYEKLKGKVPEGELELTKVPGIGPKLAQKLYHKLKTKDIDDLEKKLKKLKNDELSDIHLKRKSINKILKGIEVLRKVGGRKVLPFAEPIAREIVEKLKSQPEVGRADAVGSLRRWKETVGDIDIIAASKKPKETINYFINLPFWSEILAQGDTKATVVHQEGIQVDLEILPREKYGSLLQHFTGSKEHNVALRTWAERNGFSISEHGIKLLKQGGKLKTCETEEEVYKTLGMDYIVPELRENQGEVEAALKHQLPKLIELKDIKGDLQMHTNWTDGHQSILEMAKSSKRMGYEYIAITDHSRGLGIARGLDEKKVLKQIEEIKQAQSKVSGLKILSGTEVNINADGTLDHPDRLLEKLDVVVAAVHSAFEQNKDKMTARVISALRNPHVDILAHPSGRLLGQRDEIQIEWEEIFKEAAKNKVALEIDAFPDRLDLKDVYIIEAKKFGCKFTVDTDSHHTSHLELMRYGVAMARRGWLEKEGVYNTLDLNELLKWLKR